MSKSQTSPTLEKPHSRRTVLWKNKYEERTKAKQRCCAEHRAVRFSIFHSLCHPVSVLARALASTRAGRRSKTSSHFVPALLYPSGCAFKFPHLLLFTLCSSRAGTLPKIHTHTHTHAEFYLCADDAVFKSCVKPTHAA